MLHSDLFLSFVSSDNNSPNIITSAFFSGEDPIPSFLVRGDGRVLYNAGNAARLQGFLIWRRSIL